MVIRRFFSRIKRIYIHSADYDVLIFLQLRQIIAKSKGVRQRIAIIRYNNLCYRNNSYIPYNTKIGNNLHLPHGLFGIFISEGAIIGENVTIFHQVTIGSNTLLGTKKSGFPIIGDNVYVGAGARIIGGVRLGSGVRVGAGTVVVKDIPDNCTVVSQSGVRILTHDSEMNNTFVNYNDYVKMENNWGGEE